MAFPLRLPGLLPAVERSEQGCQCRSGGPLFASLTYSDVQGGFSGTGNIDANPLFVNGSTDPHLQSGSPALGQGTASGGPSADFDGRIFLNPPAMGAFEKTTTRTVPRQYATIQAAINASLSGDTVQVATGTYTGNGNTDLDFGGRNITLLGAGASFTVIDCQGTSTISHRGFIFQNGETNAAVVQGFTVTNGYENGANGNYGGAVAINSSSPTFRACVFSNNQVNTPGGVSEGGAVALSFSGDSPVFTNCFFVGNQVVSSNQTRGGAFYVESDADVVLTNCTFFGNSAIGGSNGNIGSALCDISPGTLTITNGIFYGDTGSPSGEFYVQGSVETTTYSDIQGGRTGTGNFSADPQFANIGNYRLSASSPCIDAGTDAGAPTTDIEGNARDAEPDLGAYEFGGHAQLTLTGQNNTAPVQQSFTGTVVTLTDANPNAAAADFTASINWGDTTTTAGTVTGGSQPFAVSGTHTYTSRGAYTVTVIVTEKTVGTQKQTTSAFTAVGIPTANAQSVSVPHDTAQAITLTGSDPDVPALTLTYAIATAPAHGTLSGTAPNLTYTPTFGYVGPDSFQFTVSNGTNTSSPATVSISVSLAGTTTTLTSSQNPSVFGQSVTFTATVTGPGGTPAAEGSVDFVDTTTSTDLGTVAVNAATGQAAVSTSSLSVASHTIIATYSDSAGVYGGSSDSLAQIVNKADTSTTLTLPSGSVDDSQTFQVSATVAAASPGAGTPTGTVTFTVNGITQDATLSGGTASLTVGPFAPGSVTISASYGGDTSFNGSSAGQQSQTVVAGTATHFSVSAPATATAGTGFSVTVTAQDAQGYTASSYTGTVHFTSTDGAASLPADYTFTAGDGGTHQLSVTLTTAGTQTVTATDTVDSSITGTSGPIQVTGLNPVPHLSTVTLSYAFLGSPTQTVLVTGTGFLPTSVVHWNGTALTTTFVDATHLSAQIPDALLTSQAAAPVTVVTPAPGGGTSNTVIYTVKVRIASLHLSKGKVKGGTTITATVTLMLPAPPNGQNIGVSCDDPAHVLLPSVKPNVKGGQTSVTFTIKTTKVTSQKTVTITAVAGGTKHETVILTP